MVDEVKEPSAPEPAQIPKIQKDRQKLTISILTVLLVLALASAGWLYWQFSQKKDQLEKRGSEVTSLEKKIAESGDKADEKTKTSGTSSTDDLPIIIFSPGGSFTDAEKTELTNKLLDPYKAWHTDQGNLVVSIHVQQNSSISASQYSVDAFTATVSMKASCSAQSMPPAKTGGFRSVWTLARLAHLLGLPTLKL